ncbi:NmrA family NAD(P)-binding protein [Streptomyces sp. NBC_01190]|uniref:NmrA family NAD(P)-binding protein n=1 Tax=Streptomyces sp. NBC_01190 TaxID=2903767 RepID=UPI00386B6DAF|nr:NmrA family NAD(P)-binding protein [Streptomyces sp. NBC_01190]
MDVVVIGATGTVGTAVVRALRERGASVRVYVRDEGKARDRLGGAGDAPGALEIVAGELDDVMRLQEALTSADVGFLALGPTGEQGRLQAQVIMAAARAKLPHLVRLAVLNTGRASLGINQRAHAALDDVVALSGLPCTSLRPALFATAVLALAPQIRATGGWTGGSAHGRNALIDPDDVAAAAVTVLLDPAARGRPYDLTGPALLSWPDVATLLSRELGVPVDFHAADDDELRAVLRAEGIPQDAAEVFIAREHAMEAGENERLTGDVERLSGSPPRPLSAYLREHRSAFLPSA